MFSLIESIKLFFLRWKDFSGRSSRSEYWWARLFTCTLVVLSLLPLIPYINVIVADPDAAKTLGLGAFVPLILVILVLAIPGLALEVRRFHDRYLTGWCVLLVSLSRRIPIVGAVLAIANIVIFCMPGTHGDNNYGPDPFGPNSEGREYLGQSGQTSPVMPVPVQNTSAKVSHAKGFNAAAMHNSTPKPAPKRSLRKAAKAAIPEVKKFEPVRWQA